MEKKITYLVFRELKIGDKFICSPTEDDDNGHGGFSGACNNFLDDSDRGAFSGTCNIFVKVEYVTDSFSYGYNAVNTNSGAFVDMSHEMEVIRVQ
jgi:hypothetical protein